MAEVTMTLYQALAKKKILESQANNITAYRMCGIVKKVGDIVIDDNISKEEARKAYQSAYDTSIATIHNLMAIKGAINEANAKTVVTIAGHEYTIANAIARYRLLDKEKQLYRRMLTNVRGIKEKVEATNSRMLSPDRIALYVSQVLGDSKKDQNLIDSTTKTYIEMNEVELYDPLNTEELATKMLENVTEFAEQFHYVLTEVNCRTNITVDFVD